MMLAHSRCLSLVPSLHFPLVGYCMDLCFPDGQVTCYWLRWQLCCFADAQIVSMTLAYHRPRFTRKPSNIQQPLFLETILSHKIAIKRSRTRRIILRLPIFNQFNQFSLFRIKSPQRERVQAIKFIQAVK